MPAESPLVVFYRHTGTDHRGRTLREIRALTLDELERHHDFIQWLFPLPEPSGANLSAPLLSAEDVRQFTSDDRLRAELIVSLDTMLRFYGFERPDDKSPDIVRAGDYHHRRAAWLTPANHNFLRMTRMLRALTLLGCAAHARAFLRSLEETYADARETIGLRTITFWRKAVQ
ncbi:MAG: hypothetical protein H0U19_13445 [Acidobacteria bacterium]|nr:hypothetical protein [Acidobacteriota bacterium]